MMFTSDAHYLTHHSSLTAPLRQQLWVFLRVRCSVSKCFSIAAKKKLKFLHRRHICYSSHLLRKHLNA